MRGVMVLYIPTVKQWRRSVLPKAATARQHNEVALFCHRLSTRTTDHV